MKMLRRPLSHPRRLRGSAAVPFALILPVVLAMMGMAIDLSVLYLRRANLQQMADSTAMAAARELNGTLTGIDNAKVFAKKMAENNYYSGIYSGSPTYFREGQSWSISALLFSVSPDGPWLPADSVTDAATASKMIYAKVDTSALAGLSAHPNQMNTSFMQFIGAPPTLTTAPIAVAGKTGMQVSPLGICALNNNRSAARTTAAGDELVEFGYRRGVPYDLLHLNPSGPSAQNYVINPIDDGAVANPNSDHVLKKYVKPFFCSGSIAFASLRSGKTVHVDTLPDIHDWLNSRFDDYSGSDACVSRNGAPPDTNVKEYTPANVGWMKTSPDTVPPPLLPSAKLLPLSSPGPMTPLITIADPATLPPSVKVKDYGPLWVNAKPVKYLSGAAFSLNDWPSLYPWNTGNPMVIPNILTYKDSPYTNFKLSPSAGIAVAGRRVLNVPLLDCTSSISGTATVLGIGKFLLISKASASSVYAEFDGLANESTLLSDVRRVK